MKYIILFLLTITSLFSHVEDSKNNLTQKEKNWIQNNTISVGIESAKPYIYYSNKKNDIDGLYSDILKLVIKKSGLKTNYIKGEWSDLLSDFKNKKLDLLPATFYSKEREKFGFYSDPYYHVREYIYVKNDIHYNSFKDMENKKIAIVKGYATITKLKEKYPTLQIVETNNLTQSITMLQNSQVDALIDYHLVVDTYLRDNSIVGLKGIAQSELEPVSVHYLSHIDKPILHSILQKSLRSISRKEMNALLKQWINVPFLKGFLTKEEIKYLKNNRFNIYINNWEPFTIYNEQDKSYKGLAIDVWNQISNEINIDHRFIFEKSFSKMLKNVQNDSQGIIISTSKTPEREKYAVFSKSYTSFPIGIATNVKENYIIDFKELEGKKVAIGKNYTAHKLLEKYYSDIEFVTVRNIEEGLNLLNKGKIFAVAEILPVLINKMGKYHYSDLKISGEGDLGFDLKIMINKENSQLVSILDKVIEQMIQDGNIQELNNKWIIRTKYIESTDYSLFYKIIVPILFILLLLLVLNFTQKRSNSVIEKQKKDLKNLNERFELTLDAVEDGIWDWNVKTDYLYISKNWAGMLGYKVDELKNDVSLFYELLHEDDLEELTKAVEFHFKDPNKNRYAVRIRLRCKDGTYKWILTRGKAILNENGEPIRMLGYHSDVTLEVKNEEHIKNQDRIIFEQSKLAAMGEMIGNIAHQWRQPLNVISTGATGLKIEQEYNTLTDQRLIETCNAIDKNAQYLSQTIDDFKNFIKGDRKKVKFNLSEDIRNFLSLVSGSIKNNDINMILDLDDSIVLDSYPNELIQSLMNIFNNSKDAFEDKEYDRYIFITTYKKDESIEILIKDNAGGIPSDILPKIFIPYFTTKHQSVGTGLGLSMTYNLVVDGLSGSIEAQNTNFEYSGGKYSGVEFKIKLPLE